MKSIVKTLLREALTKIGDEKYTTRINDFVRFAKEYLGINSGDVMLMSDRTQLSTTAAYGDGKIMVYIKNRAIVDVMRSIAHELVHHKQDLDGRLKPEDHDKNNEAGSPIENEANSIAGVLIRLYGKKNPDIYA